VMEFCETPKILIQQGNLLRVCSALIHNAIEAIDHKNDMDSKRITIRTRVADHDNNAHVEMDIEDSGMGIAPEHIDSLFDFGFSTKEIRGGRDFSLHSSRYIIRSQKGTIEATSDGPGHGSRFTIRIPILQTSSDSMVQQTEEKLSKE